MIEEKAQYVVLIQLALTVPTSSYSQKAYQLPLFYLSFYIKESPPIANGWAYSFQIS